jgi:hypothetical protein
MGVFWVYYTMRGVIYISRLKRYGNKIEINDGTSRYFMYRCQNNEII